MSKKEQFLEEMTGLLSRHDVKQLNSYRIAAIAILFDRRKQ